MMRGNHRLSIFSRGKIPLKIMLFLIPFLSLFLSLNSGNVYADANHTITANITERNILNLVPYQFNSTTASLTVTTDNPSGYSVVMYTNGNSTSMEMEGNTTNIIPTITLPSGASSIPASSIQNGYGYSMNNTDFKPVPSPFSGGDRIAEVTEVDGSTTDSYDITFGAKVGMGYTSGTYTKTFTIYIVASSPNICDPNSICYNSNGIVSGVDMEDQSVSSNSTATLMSPKFSRPGYGFAGWNTEEDGTGTTYGPNETISVGNVSASGLNLYAKWVESAGTLQNWNGCDSLSVGAVTALTDSRDNNTYAVAKLADNACWVIENSRLDLSNQNLSITAENTNHPTTDFMNAINQHPASSTSFCTNANSSCINRVAFNASGVYMSSEDFWPSYGVYYNWYTATAGNGTYSMSDPRVKVAGDICPAGWSLPNGYSINGDYALLDIALGGNGKNQTSTAMSNKWRSYPNNFLYSGQQNGNAITNRADTGNYQGSSASSNTNFVNLWLQSNKVSVNTNGSNKTRGQSVRCMIQKYYKIHYDANTTATVDGTMYDQDASLNNNIVLDSNTFVIEPQNSSTYRFIGWNTKADGSGDSYADGATVRNLGTNGETVTLYAQWDVSRNIDVTVSFTSGAVSRISIENNEYGSHSVTQSGTVVSLVQSKPYKISVVLDGGYEFDGWTTTEGGTLSSTTVSPAYYTVTENATLTALTSQSAGPLYLQNLNPSACTATPKIAYDIRDGQSYTIARLNDGKCWFLDDLRLGAEDLDEALSSENTNMPENKTLTFTEPSRIYQYTVPEIDSHNAGNIVTHYGSGSGKAGVYYNFCAASAETVCSDSSPENASYDICPAGWRLPTGGSSGEINQLYRSYSSKISDFLSAWGIAFSGWYDANARQFKDYNSAVAFWSSTAYNNINKTFPARISATQVNFTTGYLENNGLDIRCVLK